MNPRSIFLNFLNSSTICFSFNEEHRPVVVRVGQHVILPDNTILNREERRNEVPSDFNREWIKYLKGFSNHNAIEQLTIQRIWQIQHGSVQMSVCTSNPLGCFLCSLFSILSLLTVLQLRTGKLPACCWIAIRLLKPFKYLIHSLLKSDGTSFLLSSRFHRRRNTLRLTAHHRYWKRACSPGNLSTLPSDFVHQFLELGIFRSDGFKFYQNWLTPFSRTLEAGRSQVRWHQRFVKWIPCLSSWM